MHVLCRMRKVVFTISPLLLLHVMSSHEMPAGCEEMMSYVKRNRETPRPAKAASKVHTTVSGHAATVDFKPLLLPSTLAPVSSVAYSSLPVVALSSLAPLSIECGAPGASGQVYKITYKGKDAAAKKFHDHMLPSLQRELKSLQLLAHPNIVRIFSVIADAKMQHIGFIMEYLPIALDHAMLRMSTKQAVHALNEIAIGIAAAHDARIIHSDIKPANILCSPDLESVKVADFGLAHVMNNASQSKLSTSRGTPLYIAPELNEPPHQPSIHSDMFSFGMTAWQVCIVLLLNLMLLLFSNACGGCSGHFFLLNQTRQ
jgi:serine/threonine protein kinase